MKKYMTAFYVEAVMLVITFGVVILMLAGVFTAARVESTRAARLTRAVALAQNSAEAVAAANDLEGVCALLATEGESTINDGVLTLTDAEGYVVSVTWVPQGGVAASTITVQFEGETIYTLQTAAYLQEAAG